MLGCLSAPSAEQAPLYGPSRRRGAELARLPFGTFSGAGSALRTLARVESTRLLGRRSVTETTKAAFRRAVRHIWRDGIVPAIHGRHPFGAALRAARGARALPASCLSSRTRSGSRPSLSARNAEGRLAAAFVGTGGERGIRTLDGCFCTHTPLAGEPLRPLGHLSVTVRNRLQGPRPRCRLPCESSGKSPRGVLRRPSVR